MRAVLLITTLFPCAPEVKIGSQMQLVKWVSKLIVQLLLHNNNNNKKHSAACAYTIDPSDQYVGTPHESL